MTEAIKKKLRDELEELETELRIHLPQEIKKAKEFGDLRENAEYKAALERQEIVRARIAQLRQRLSEIGSIELSKIPRDKVAYGSTVVLYDSEKDEEVKYRLVTPEESNPQEGLISTVSPIGKSLMGKEEGDEVVVRTPAGSRNFEIMRLTTLHDEAKQEG
jgi:transcription elongation factor GreA